MCIRDREKTSTFDGIEIVTGETYQPVSEGKNTMKNVAMGDTMEKGNLYRSARVADPVSYTHLDVYKRQKERKGLEHVSRSKIKKKQCHP